MSNPDYKSKIEQQIAQYNAVAAGEEAIHDLPPAFHYWSVNHIAPKLQEVFDTSNIDEIFANALIAGRKHNTARLASIGAGDCSSEIRIGELLCRRGFFDFKFDCYELNPGLIERGKTLCRNSGLTDKFSFIEADINQKPLLEKYDGVMANHSLHHFVELEYIFETISASLVQGGNFVTYDMIGRNGHMRWPEVFSIVSRIWDSIDISKKYNHQLRETWDTFINWDCSHEGFEGVRAQDILPELLKRFHFSHFFATGCITEIFVDRAFGPNFDRNNPDDVAFIEMVENLNSILLDAGTIKPTIMFAVMNHHATSCKHLQYRTPQSSLRNPTGIL